MNPVESQSDVVKTPGLFSLHSLAVGFRVGIEKIIQRLASLLRDERDVAAGGKRHAIAGVAAEEEIFFIGFAISF